ncbi:helix-turn-helix domain-containing protein [Paenibacillus yanchengensis]|uniref:Helix-turn-helix domain-containing protein n=1 Tax=Paenibacillus yanchengensis TaxID=2035833 RepID=A0ABW4YR62_9BACL
MTVILLQLHHIAAALHYLNQITTSQTEDHFYHVHSWYAQVNHHDNQTHKHSFFEVCYVFSGEGIYEDEHKQYPLKSGVLFCSRPHVWHRIRDGKDLQLAWVCFEMNKDRSSPAAIQQYDQLCKTDLIYIADASHTPTALMWQTLLHQADQLNGLTTVLQPLATIFLTTLIKSFLPSVETNERAITVNTDADRLLQQAKTFINDNLSQPLTFSKIAQYLHLSERTLSRIFSEKSNLTFRQYVTTVRLHKAEQLLLQSDLSIKEIAVQTGFESVHYLTKVFANHYGMPPGKYRREYKERTD